MGEGIWLESWALQGSTMAYDGGFPLILLMETLEILRKTTYQLVQDFFHKQYEWQQLGPHNWSYFQSSLIQYSNQFRATRKCQVIVGFFSIVILVEAGGMDILLRTLTVIFDINFKICTVHICIHVHTWNPNGPCFDWKRPCFGGFNHQSRGHWGSRFTLHIPYVLPCSWPEQISAVYHVQKRQIEKHNMCSSLHWIDKALMLKYVGTILIHHIHPVDSFYQVIQAVTFFFTHLDVT